MHAKVESAREIVDVALDGSSDELSITRGSYADGGAHYIHGVQDALDARECIVVELDGSGDEFPSTV